MSNRPTIIIGLTGPIGCGKSTIAGWLRDQDADVIDADQVARDVTPRGSPELNEIVKVFGPGVLSDDQSLDRAALGRIVFADPDALRRLEKIIHPSVRRRIMSRIEAARAADRQAVIVIEAIKLVEGGLAELCTEVWLVTCDPAEQLARVIARATERGQEPGDAVARIAAQGDLTARLRPRANVVIDTTGGRLAAFDQVATAWLNAIS